jgi:hypothetical protein
MPSLDLDALSALCIPINPAPGDICIPFPGGAEICPAQGLQMGDPSEVLQALLAQLSVGLAPLQPLFILIGVVKAVIDCVQAIPDTLGPPPDPTALMECIPPLVKKLEKMLALLPQYTVPLLVKRMLALVILTLTALKNELQVIIAEQQAILASATLASLPGNELLQAIVDCATTNADTTLANMQSSMKPLGALLDVVNIMLELIGSDPITGVPDLQGGAEEALKPIDDFIAVLRQAEAMIPG